jgi:predicted ATP-dependent endonuclease of OLD family
MRLISARVRGAGRLVDTTVKLDQKLVAIVGPNEAGKTTLLKALAYADGSAAMTMPQRSRSGTVQDSTPVVSLHYRVSDIDREDLLSLELEEAPTELFVSRRADGGEARIDVRPAPRKSEAPLKQLAVDFGTALESLTALEPIPVEGQEGDEAPPELPDGSTLLDELRLLHQDLESFLSAKPAEHELVAVLRQRSDDAAAALKAFVETDSLRELLPRLGAWVDREDPTTAVRDQLWNRTPDVVMFSEQDRTLETTHVLDENLVAAVPAALANLARLADLDLKLLVEAVETSQISRRDTIKNKANIKLAEYFKSAWQQSDLKVELNVESNILRIGLVEDGVHASVFDERSAGLRMFVALTAFLASRNTGRPTILLIDEAETHLHIDAQADLVEMFAQQDKADKIIYTTHSPACLPADLGVGIRAVVPNGEETSYVENSFWRQDGGAFSSLMIAMGASAAAFTPARCAVIAEGASDMILLPSLVRAATGLDRLPYQVAPGLSEVPKAFYPELDFEAAKVAFLVDGDGGGDDLAKALDREIPAARIVKLDVPGIENVLDAECYSDAFVTQLREHNPNVTISDPPALPAAGIGSWANVLEGWAENAGRRVPSKREVANQLVEHGVIKLSPEGTVALKAVNQALLKALGIKT